MPLLLSLFLLLPLLFFSFESFLLLFFATFFFGVWLWRRRWLLLRASGRLRLIKELGSGVLRVIKPSIVLTRATVLILETSNRELILAPLGRGAVRAERSGAVLDLPAPFLAVVADRGEVKVVVVVSYSNQPFIPYAEAERGGRLITSIFLGKDKGILVN